MCELRFRYDVSVDNDGMGWELKDGELKREGEIRMGHVH